jgi:hypothetical protein
MKLQAGQDCNLYNEAQHNVPGLRIVHYYAFTLFYNVLIINYLCDMLAAFGRQALCVSG